MTAPAVRVLSNPTSRTSIVPAPRVADTSVNRTGAPGMTTGLRSTTPPTSTAIVRVPAVVPVWNGTAGMPTSPTANVNSSDRAAAGSGGAIEIVSLPVPDALAGASNAIPTVPLRALVASASSTVTTGLGRSGAATDPL